MSGLAIPAHAIASALPAADEVIRFDAVSKLFRSGPSETWALDAISLSVSRGAFVALIGPSGCGKTTLLNLVAGLLSADGGAVSYQGARVRGPNSRVGYLTQIDALLPWRTVLANIALPLEIKRVPKADRIAATRDIIDRIGLAGFERHYPGQLSGGMRKRVALARTLIYQPETLLLDEPFSALDAQTRVILQKQLRNLVRDRGLTVLLVTHDIDEAIALADTIIVFSRRPARMLETIAVPAQPEFRSARHGGVRGAIYDQVWALLADQIDITAGP
jgi:NitT/TauT family transport system ATP-binding protein